MLWRREWLPTAVFLPRESHGLKSLLGYSPRGHDRATNTKWEEYPPKGFGAHSHERRFPEEGRAAMSLQYHPGS